MSEAQQFADHESLPSLSEEKREDVENVLNEARASCLEVAPTTEIQLHIEASRKRLNELLGDIPPHVEETLESYAQLNALIQQRRLVLMTSALTGEFLQRTMRANIDAIIAPQFPWLTDEELDQLEEKFNDVLNGRKSTKQKKRKSSPSLKK